jgi:hypothetical protein
VIGFGAFTAQRKLKGFHPSQVPQIAAGEYWLPGVGVSGTNPVLWAGRNGTNTLSTAPAQAPDAVTGPGGNPAWQFVAANSDIFAQASPAGPLTVTDGLYLAFWFRFDALSTVFQTVIEQFGLAGARRWSIQKSASLSALQIIWSDDGTNQLTASLSATEGEGVGNVSILDKYLFAEVAIDPAASGLSNKTRLWFDLRQQTLTLGGTGGAALFNGGIFRVGNNNFENQDFNGQIGPIYIGRKVNGTLVPSLAERYGLMQYLSPKARSLQVICDGNSLTAGQGATVPFVTSYPGVLRASLAAAGFPSRDTHDRGFGGSKSQDMINRFATHVAPFYDPVFNKSAYVFFEVRNSTQAGETAEAVQAQHATLGLMAQEAGFFVVVCTAPGSDGAPAGQGVPGQVNAWIRSNWHTFAHAMVDLESEPEFSPSGDILNPTYYIDGVHLTDAGYAKVAQVVQAAIT